MHFSLVGLRLIIGRYLIFDWSGYSPLEMFCMKPDQLGLQSYSESTTMLAITYLTSSYGVPAHSFLRHPPTQSSLSLPPPSRFLKSLFPLCFFDSSPHRPALIRSTNLLLFKQISKGQFYQLSYRFLSRINLLNPFANRLS